jgi:hypothetical protein
MPIKTGWIVEKRVVLIRMRGAITTEDVRSWSDRAIGLLDDVRQEPIFVLVDQSKVQGLRGFNELVKMAVLRHPKIRDIKLYAIYGVQNRMLIQADRFMAQLSTVLTQFFDTEVAAQ